MNKEQINKTIAEFEGWIFRNEFFFPWLSPSGTACINPPNYTREIHQIKFALKKLNCPQRKKFIHKLTAICDRDFGNSEVDPSDVLDPNEMAQMFLIDCSSEQLAEALFLTIKKEEK